MHEATASDAISELVNLQSLSRWMDDQRLDSGPIDEVRVLAGGTQNIVVQFRRGKSRFVLRRPSAILRANSNRTMMREAEVLRALKGTEVPHPALVAACEDTAILGAAFYLMEPVAGFNPTSGLPELHRCHPEIRHRMGLALVEGAAALAAVDFQQVGLGNFGKPEGFLERQTARWRSQLDSYSEHAGWPGPSTIPGLTTVERWLEDNLPTSSFRPGILHGDYHIGNVLYQFDGPELAAIIDWELATIGDSLLDLAWLLATWPDEQGLMPNPAIEIQPQEGFPTAAELVAHYKRCSTRDLSAVSWYAVLACYKLGIILEGTYARACAGKASIATGNQLHAATRRLFERALYWIHSG